MYVSFLNKSRLIWIEMEKLDFSHLEHILFHLPCEWRIRQKGASLQRDQTGRPHVSPAFPSCYGAIA
jgi:hypothetical protein